MSKKALITGVTGQDGSYLAELLLEKGYEETTVLDIISEMGGLTRGAFYHHFKSTLFCY